MGLPDLEVVHETGDVLDHLEAVGVVFPGLAGVAVAAEVEGDDLVALGEELDGSGELGQLTAALCGPT